MAAIAYYLHGHTLYLEDPKLILQPKLEALALISQALLESFAEPHNESEP